MNLCAVDLICWLDVFAKDTLVFYCFFFIVVALNTFSNGLTCLLVAHREGSFYAQYAIQLCTMFSTRMTCEYLKNRWEFSKFFLQFFKKCFWPWETNLATRFFLGCSLFERHEHSIEAKKKKHCFILSEVFFSFFVSLFIYGHFETHSI